MSKILWSDRFYKTGIISFASFLAILIIHLIINIDVLFISQDCCCSINYRTFLIDGLIWLPLVLIALTFICFGIGVIFEVIEKKKST